MGVRVRIRVRLGLRLGVRIRRLGLRSVSELVSQCSEMVLDSRKIAGDVWEMEVGN